MCIYFTKLNVKAKDFLFTNKISETMDLECCDQAITTDYDGLSGICYFDKFMNSIYIRSIEVRNDCKGQGIGTKLINMLKEKTNKIYLSAIPGSEPFYIKNGFTKAKDEDYYIWTK